MPLRIVSGLFVLLLIVAVVWTLRSLILLEELKELLRLGNFIPLLEAGINDVILIGAGIFFLVSAETRIKRRRVLNSLHRLRVFAHIIDMHQLHKDPERVLQRGELTPSTPKIDMTPFELSRYLDYCSELLSLTGIIAGLYAQNSEDRFDRCGSDIEQLTNGISRKIWQKLMILDCYARSDDRGTRRIFDQAGGAGHRAWGFLREVWLGAFHGDISQNLIWKMETR
jgi:hypothetical protein